MIERKIYRRAEALKPRGRPATTTSCSTIHILEVMKVKEKVESNLTGGGSKRNPNLLSLFSNLRINIKGSDILEGDLKPIEIRGNLKEIQVSIRTT